jgi:hypothetical protein
VRAAYDDFGTVMVWGRAGMSGSLTGFCGIVIWKVTTLLLLSLDPVGAADCVPLMATPDPNAGRCLPQRWSFGNFFLPGPGPIPSHTMA